MILFLGMGIEIKVFMVICVEILKRFVDFIVFIKGKCYRILKIILYYCVIYVG